MDPRGGVEGWCVGRVGIGTGRGGRVAGQEYEWGGWALSPCDLSEMYPQKDSRYDLWFMVRPAQFTGFACR